MNDRPDPLTTGLAALNITATPQQQTQLRQFLFLLRKWNRVYNLTAISEPEQAIPLHLLDSLAVLPYLSGNRILDVGTGAGLPGIPLAIIAIGVRFVLLDSNAKKTRFVQQAVLELGLTNVEVVTSRIENYRPQQGFDSILARAWADLETIWRETRVLLASEGQVLALKGQCPTRELDELETCQYRIHSLEIPRLQAERHLIQITND
ncbi:MAG: 16S rRNA (guanine(527)-N(7))-methyltransferase RsmG [Methylococcaceae bacterium]